MLFGLLFGLPAGLLGGLLTGLLTGLFGQRGMIKPAEALTWSWEQSLAGLFTGLLFGLPTGLSGRLLTGLLFGIRAAMQHYLLRCWLWHTFPLRAVPFLEDATMRILLQRVGGGYSFAHRLLLDYFASLEKKEP